MNCGSLQLSPLTVSNADAAMRMFQMVQPAFRVATNLNVLRSAWLLQSKRTNFEIFQKKWILYDFVRQNSVVGIVVMVLIKSVVRDCRCSNMKEHVWVFHC